MDADARRHRVCGWCLAHGLGLPREVAAAREPLRHAPVGNHQPVAPTTRGNALREARESRATPTGLGLFSYGFRPFFLGAGLWGAAAIGLWIAMLITGLTLPSRFDPLSWHVHEMLFGFVLAAVAGFLLTAIPNWTGRRPVAGTPLAILAGLWTLGRIAAVVSSWMPAWLAVLADLAFPVALTAVVAREITVSGNRRNLPIIAPVGVLTLAE